jgi:ABC-2 type transport system permease protein
LTSGVSARLRPSPRLIANARVVSALSMRSLRQAFRRPQFLAPIVIFPSLFLAVNVGGAGRATDIPAFPDVAGFLDFELAGAIVQSTMLAAVSGGIALALDIESGFMDRLFASPISRTAIVVGRLASTAVMGVLAGVWFVSIGLIFGAEIKGGVLGVLLVILLSAACASAWGGFGAALALRSGTASVVQGIFPLVFVIIFLSSAFFPGNLLLEPAKTISDWNPMSFIAEGIRDPIISDISAEPLLECLAAIAGIMALGAVLSVWGLRKRVAG